MLGAVLAAILLCSTLAQGKEPNHFVYQIFVRSFADSPSDTHPAGEIGDLRGIRENLDYLNDLGVGILWLMPIFPTTTYHGYDIVDFRAVNPEYGTLQDLRDLVREAHRRRVRVILDIAFNHTSNTHPWFLTASREPDSPFRNFYHWNWKGVAGAYEASFGRNMPDLNFDEPAVRSEVKAIAKFWLDQGIDGFRLDAAKHIYEGDALKNNQWWREFFDHVYSIKPEAVLVGEVLGTPEVLRNHAVGLDGLLDAPFLHAARDYLVSPRAGFVSTWIGWLKSYRQANPKLQPWVFLGSHDETPRLASFLQERTPDRVEERYRLGMFLLFSMARHPVVYNGDELMQRGVKWPNDGSRVYDMTLREPFPWYGSRKQSPQTGWFQPRYDKPDDGVSVEEQQRQGTMLDLVRRLSKLRAQHPRFANSEIDAVLTDSAEWVAFTKNEYLVLIRTANTPGAYSLANDAPLWRNSRVVFSSAGTSKRTGGKVPVREFGFVLLKR